MIDLLVPFAGRTDRLRDLLASCAGHEELDRVIIGHNCPDPLVTPPCEVPVTVLDCGTDYIPGHARRETYEASTAPYLLVVDSDMELPLTIEPLLHIMEEEYSLGGVGGGLVEPAYNRVRHTGKRFEIKGGQLIKDSQGGVRRLERAGREPFVRFDQLANCTLFRRECLEEYAWDPAYPKRAHLDFFLGHYIETDWDFAATPSVNFYHWPGGTEEYRERRHSDERHQAGLDRIEEKWGITNVTIPHHNWMLGQLK